MNSELDSLTPSRDFNRRDFVRTAVGGSFAAAVLPVAATEIKTSAEGLIAGEVMIPVGDFQMPAYRSMPAGKKHAPVILVISEIFGVHQHIADITRRLAHQGYLAIAPELFIRQGDAGDYGEISKLIAEVISKVPDEQVMGDLDATVAWAAANGGDTTKLGITGFCWGGRITWLYAERNPKVKAAVAWYGKLVGDSDAPNPLTPRQPIDMVSALHAPVLGLYGGQDGGISVGTIAQMQEALRGGNKAARESEFVVYPDAPHAFNADYRSSYREADAKDGWARLLAWFKAHGVRA